MLYSKDMHGLKNKSFIILTLLTCVLALYLRLYTISKDMPFFYEEDEAHHFNRTVNMAKGVDFNPRYFHKPSLHFYLRMPVVWLSALYAEQKGFLNSMSEIRTYNKYGLARFEFTASHPTIVKANRAFSVLLGVLSVLLTILIAKELLSSKLLCIFAGLVSAVSPPLITYSGIIGVDIVMTFMSLMTVYFAARTSKKFSSTGLFMTAVFAGLAISSKYNAAPIAALPFLVLLFTKNLKRQDIVIALGIPVISFFAASPYILIAFTDFYRELSYEVWHYAVAGHEGNSGERGIPQILFYSRWLYESALGYLLFILCAIGLLFLAVKREKQALVVFAFPLLFFFLMIMQKVNFTRNMIVIIPFAGILAAYALDVFFKKFRNSFDGMLLAAICALSLIQPIANSFHDKEAALNVPESRKLLTAWFIANNSDSKKTAAAAELLLPYEIRKSANVTRFSISEKNISALRREGFKRIITGALPADISGYRIHSVFPGEKEKQRIVKNPEINVLESLD